jgi:hypothetical protein
MRRTTSLVIVGLLVLSASTAYGQTLQSETTWGGVGAEFAGGVAVAPDGSSYFTGTSDSFAVDQFGFGVPRIFLVRFTSTGALDWQRIWNGQTGHGRTALALAPDGSVYVAGLASANNDGDAVLLKFSAAGTLLWERTWGGPAQESGDGVGVASDGSVYIGGRTTSFDGALFVVKFDSSGNLVWQKVYDYVDPLIFNVIGETLTVAADGSVYAAGTSVRNGDLSLADQVTVKISPGGALQWARRYTAGDVVDSRGGIAAAPNGGSIAIVGTLQGEGGGVNDPVLVNLDAAGNLVFDRTWAGKNTGGDGLGVAIAANGTIYMSGTIDGIGAGFQDAFVVSVLPNGKGGMAATWGGPGFDEGRGVAVAADGTVVLGAQTTQEPPYTLASASKKLSSPRGDLAADPGQLVDVVGTVTNPADGAATPDGSTTFPGGSLESVLIRFIP